MSPPTTNSRRPIPGVKDMLAVSSGKGGVGKSTISANLAIALAHRGYRIGLLDTDIYGPTIPGMLGLRQKPELAADGLRLRPCQAQGLHVISMGLFVERGAPLIWRGPMLAKMTSQFLFNIDWGALDLLILDLPPGTGDVQLTLTQQACLTASLIVTTPSTIAIEDVRRGVEMFHQTAVPILGLVENMSSFICHQCGHASAVFGEAGGQRLADQLGIPLLAQIPLDTQLCQSADSGIPMIEAFPDSPTTGALHRLTDEVVARIFPC